MPDSHTKGKPAGADTSRLTAPSVPTSHSVWAAEPHSGDPIRSGGADRAPFVACILLLLIAGNAFSDEYVDKVRQQRAAVRAEAYLSEGKGALQRGDYLKAIRVFSAALQNGAGVEASRLRANAYYRKGAYAEATADLTRVINSGSADLADRVLRGDVYNARHDYENAMIDYREAIQKDPLHVDSYKGRATVYLALEKYDLAMRDLQLVLRSEPSDGEALYNMGMACILADLPSSARSFLESAMKVETSDGWRRRVDGLLTSLPESSPYERGVGGLAGYLEASSQAQKDSKPSASGAGPQAKVAGIPEPRHSGESKSGDASALKKDLLSSRPENSHLKGNLSGSHMGFDWRFQFDSKGRNVTGLLQIRGPAGIEEKHSCVGTVDRGLVEMSDRTGNSFHGRITDDLRLMGALSTNRGQSFSVNIPLKE